jgi:hypothetical protein
MTGFPTEFRRYGVPYMLGRVPLFAVLVSGCAAPPPASPDRYVVSSSGGAPASRPAPRPPLTSREAALRGELERDIGYLTAQVGERNPGKKWEYASAADWIAGEFEAAGLPVERLGVEGIGDAVALDLEATRRGGRLGREVVIVSAHYDSPVGSVGADDNATGVAALLALARGARAAEPSRTVRLVATALRRGPSLAKRLGARGEAVYAELNLESLGYYSDEPGSQRCPRSFGADCPTVGNFAAVVAAERSRSMLDVVKKVLGERASLPVHGFSLEPAGEREFASDATALSGLGFPVVTVTDTGPLRNPHHDTARDTPERLDFDRLARLVAGLEKLVRELGGGDAGPGVRPEPHVHAP